MPVSGLGGLRRREHARGEIRRVSALDQLVIRASVDINLPVGRNVDDLASFHDRTELVAVEHLRHHGRR